MLGVPENHPESTVYLYASLMPVQVPPYTSYTPSLREGEMQWDACSLCPILPQNSIEFHRSFQKSPVSELLRRLHEPMTGSGSKNSSLTPPLLLALSHCHKCVQHPPRDMGRNIRHIQKHI